MHAQNAQEEQHPDASQADKDLPMAKHTIDILAMLQAKTKGNLTAAEEKLKDEFRKLRDERQLKGVAFLDSL